MKLGKLLKPVRRVFMCKSVRHVAAICAVFALVIGGGAYAAHHSGGLGELLGLFSSRSVPSSAPPELISRSDNLTGSASMKDDDPVKNFTRTGVGQVLFSTASTDTCKRTLFDNKTGSYKEVADINCNASGQMIDNKKSEQLQSMRKAFNR